MKSVLVIFLLQIFGYYCLFIGENVVIKQRYQLQEIIGSGSYGIVMKARDLNRTGNHHVAVKIMFTEEHEIKLSPHETRKFKISRRDAQDEISTFRALDNQCKYCIERLESFRLNSTYFIVMPLMDETLREFIYSQHHLSLAQIQLIGRQLLLGLECMHSRGIAHNDLKIENILVRYSDNSVPDVRLADFSLSVPIEEYRLGEYPWHRTTSWYEDPIVTLFGFGSLKSDIWSIGLLMAEMYYQRPILPVSDDMFRMYALRLLYGIPEFPGELFQVVNKDLDLKKPLYLIKSLYQLKYPLLTNRMFLNMPPSLNSWPVFNEFRAFVLQCLSLNPIERPTAEEALMHPFMRMQIE